MISVLKTSNGAFKTVFNSPYNAILLECEKNTATPKDVFSVNDLLVRLSSFDKNYPVFQVSHEDPTELKSIVSSQPVTTIPMKNGQFELSFRGVRNGVLLGCDED